MDRRLEERLCSFCGKFGSTENRLAGGLGAMICMECLELYHAETRSPAVVAEQTRSVWEEMSNTQLLATLPLILRSAEQNSEFAVEWVDLIRARKISWAEIGKVLGVSRQAAWERFASKCAALASENATG